MKKEDLELIQEIIENRKSNATVVKAWLKSLDAPKAIVTNTDNSNLFGVYCPDGCVGFYAAVAKYATFERGKIFEIDEEFKSAMQRADILILIDWESCYVNGWDFSNFPDGFDYNPFYMTSLSMLLDKAKEAYEDPYTRKLVFQTADTYEWSIYTWDQIEDLFGCYS